MLFHRNFKEIDRTQSFDPKALIEKLSIRIGIGSLFFLHFKGGPNFFKELVWKDIMFLNPVSKNLFMKKVGWWCLNFVSKKTLAIFYTQLLAYHFCILKNDSNT